MERTTIYLDSALRRRLKESAAAQGESEAFVLREALAEYLSKASRPKVKPVGRSRDGGVARRVDEALEREGFGKR